ncbi:MAG TPA: SDR family oxidoreductase, partial [Gaiellaceae bacterium]|nr:SDR family oxidoreductase [Gaiellaceae bacterium]
MKLEGKVAIITGAGSGIGQATARRFAGDGARLVLNDVSEDYLAELEDALGSDHAYVAGDVSREETAERLAATARERFGRIDVLVNNVGDLYIAEITETSVEDWDRLMATNLRSMFLCCKHVIPSMLEQGGGSIVNLSSISAFIGQEAEEGGPSFFAYSVTKAGARQLATNLATRYAKHGIRVNAVAPGATRTRQVRHFMPDLSQEAEDAIWENAGAQGTPMGRV